MLLQPGFILEGKAPVESSRGDGGGREAGSISPSPATLLLTHESPGPWQSESLLAESWSTMGDLDPEDTKSLDSSNEAAAASEENHSSNSDMVHLEQEEAEMLEEEEENVGRAGEEEEEEDDEELQTSVLSVLGGERELVDLREEEEEVDEEEEEDFQAPEMEDEPFLVPTEFRRLVPPMSLPPLPVVKLDPPSTTSTPVPSTTVSEVEEPYPAQGLLPPSILTPKAAEPLSESLEQLHFSQIPLSDVEEHSVEVGEAASEKTKPLSSTELLCGGALLVAVVGVVAYGAVAYCRK